MVRTKKTARRRTTAKKPAKRKTTKKTTKRKSTTVKDTESNRQLAMYFNPFSRATKQPKIPDGKVGDSLGFQTQSVREIVGIADSESSTMHILMYPGMNSGCVIANEAAGVAAYTNPNSQLNIVGYVGSNDIDTSGTDGTNGNGNIRQTDSYSHWRIVSQGLKLALLNPVEEDDGWWESCRVRIAKSGLIHRLMPRDLASGTSAKTQMTVCPTGAITQLIASPQITNEHSYATGTLRQLKNVRFDLHPMKDEHDFHQLRDGHRLETTDIISYDPTDQNYIFREFSDNWLECVENFEDDSMDMVYIRIHGRSSGSATKLHLNLVANQEIVFGPTVREARFHTSTHNDPKMEQYVHASREDRSSANVVPM